MVTDVLSEQIERAQKAAAQVAEQDAQRRQAERLPALERQAKLTAELAEAEQARAEMEERLRQRLSELQVRGASIRRRFEFVISELAALPAEARTFMHDLTTTAKEMGRAIKRVDDLRRALAGGGPAPSCPFDEAHAMWKENGGESKDLYFYPAQLPQWFISWRDGTPNMPIGYHANIGNFRRILY